MKNILIILLTLLLIISIAGCAHNPEIIQAPQDNNSVLIPKKDKVAVEPVENKDITPPISVSAKSNPGQQNDKPSDLTESSEVLNITNSNNKDTKYCPPSVQAKAETNFHKQTETII